MATHKYLDTTGLGQVWEKIKGYADPFIVTITSATSNGTTTYSFDKTFAEITTAYNAGKVCIAKDSASTYYLSFINSSTIRFIYILISTSANIQTQSGIAFEINSSNVVTRTNKNWYSTSSIKNICVGKEAIGKINGTYSWATGTGSFSETAYQNYSEGDLFWRTNTELVKAITNISSGATLTENTNYIVTTIDDELKSKLDSNDVLTKTNTISYTPTADYNPATKKYVDDSISGFSTTLSGLSDTTITSVSDEQVLIYDGTTSKWINSDMHQPADDIDVINLLSQYGFSTPLEDADDNLIVDADDNIIMV